MSYTRETRDEMIRAAAGLIMTASRGDGCDIDDAIDVMRKAMNAYDAPEPELHTCSTCSRCDVSDRWCEACDDKCPDWDEPHDCDDFEPRELAQ